jgi:hypothetical protein
MDEFASPKTPRAQVEGRRLSGRTCVTLFLLAAVVLSLTAAPVSAASPGVGATNPRVVRATTHSIEYRIGCPPSMVDDGVSLAYFKAHGFSAVDLVVPDNKTYQNELKTIKSYGMTAAIDVEVPIWNAGSLQSTPITSFGSYFQSLKNAGWEYVASEGGRAGDLNYMKQFFKGYINYNCDQCGLWLDVYKDPFTVANVWESYYPSEWQSIQSGSKQAAAVGIQNGILAGVWSNNGGVNQILANSLSGSTPSYLSMLDWSYVNGIGFTHFEVWCGLNSQGLSFYKALGFETVVANLQTYYPPTGSAGGWQWSKIGGQLASGTGAAVCAQNTNSLDVFVQGADRTLWHTQYRSGSGWSGWQSLGGALTSSPAATSPGNGIIDVFVRGTNGALYEKTTTDGGNTWSTWTSLGGQIPAGTAPAACSWGSGRFDIFVQGMNGALYHKSFARTWSGWENLGGILTSSPAASSAPGSSRIDVFVRGTNGALYQRSWIGSWSTWTSLGGQIPAGTAPAACSWGALRLDIFVQGTDRALYRIWNTGTWSDWQSLGGSLTSSPGATARGDGSIAVFVRGTDGALWEGT